MRAIKIFTEEKKKVDSSLTGAAIKKIFNEKIKDCREVFGKVLVLGELNLKKEF